jgi:hypothetical protein
MVTHSSTSRPVQCLCMAERTKYDLLTRKPDSRFEFQNPEFLARAYSSCLEHIINGDQDGLLTRTVSNKAFRRG